MVSSDDERAKETLASAVGPGLLPDAAHQEYVVVDAEGDEEHKGDEGDERIDLLSEYVADDEHTDAEGAEERQHHAADDDPDESRDRNHAEDVNPGADVIGLAVWEQVVHREVAIESLADAQGPASALVATC